MSSPTDPRSSAKPPTSLARALLISHGLLAGVTVIGFAIAIVVTQYRSVIRQCEGELLGAAEALRQDLLDEVPPGELSIPDSFVERFGRAPRDQAYWVLWSTDGQRVAWGGKLPEQKMIADLRPPDAPPHPKGRHRFQAERVGRELELILEVDQHRRLVIGRPLAKEFDGLFLLASRLSAFSVLAIVVAVLVASWISRRVAEPIQDLASTARRLSCDQLNERLYTPQPTIEMNELAIAFNAMLENLQQAFDRQKRFVADAAHELRTPVSIVLAQSEHSLTRERSSADYQSGFQTIRSTARHMKRLVDDLLTLSQIDAGQMTLNRTSIDLKTLIDEAITMVSLLAEQKAIVVTGAYSSVFVRGDAVRLRQVLLNLLANAIQFSNSGSHVIVSLNEETEAAILTIRDHGVGMTSDELSRVWDRFYQVDQARTITESSGRGLGLSLVAEMVRLHGGRVALHSTPGEGSVATIFLPKDDLTQKTTKIVS